MKPCYTTPPLTSLLPFLFLLIGRGAQADSGEPLLWQLPQKRRTQGQPDICQWPPQSDRAWQKPIRWDAAAAGFQGQEQELAVNNEFRAKCDQSSLVEAHTSGLRDEMTSLKHLTTNSKLFFAGQICLSTWRNSMEMLYLLCNIWDCLAMSFVPVPDLQCQLPFEHPDYHILISCW